MQKFIKGIYFAGFNYIVVIYYKEISVKRDKDNLRFTIQHFHESDSLDSDKIDQQ